MVLAVEAWLITQAVYFLRILAAALCGAVIGYERENRLKTAGIRTHIIVCIASALMMIISKYGFDDILGSNGVGLDPSRIAAGVVTAIGFLGAGVIFVHKQTVSGLTTSAGIWATVGIGLGIGAGMYIMGIATTLLILLLQILLHRHLTKLKTPMTETLVLVVGPGRAPVESYLSKLRESHIEVLHTALSKQEDGSVRVKLSVRFPEAFTTAEAVRLLLEDDAVQSMNL